MSSVDQCWVNIEIRGNIECCDQKRRADSGYEDGDWCIEGGDHWSISSHEKNINIGDWEE